MNITHGYSWMLKELSKEEKCGCLVKTVLQKTPERTE
jgi:hypothetical protein